MNKFPSIANDIPATGIISTLLTKSPWMNKLTMQERLDFAREYADRLEWGAVIMTGPHAGTEVNLNKKNYTRMRKIYGQNNPNFEGYVNAQCDMLQRNIDDGTASYLTKKAA